MHFAFNLKSYRFRRVGVPNGSIVLMQFAIDDVIVKMIRKANSFKYEKQHNTHPKMIIVNNFFISSYERIQCKRKSSIVWMRMKPNAGNASKHGRG